MAWVTITGKSRWIQGSMRQILVKSIPRSGVSCKYHSYPDPDDVPVITSTKSEIAKSVSKVGAEFEAVKTRFNMSKEFDIPVDIKDPKFLQQPDTIVSKLSNGLTVASQDMPGLMSSIALLVKSGSSSEQQSGLGDNTGTAHLSELIAFHSTAKRTHEQLHTEVEKLGGMVQCIAQKESIIYFIDVFRNQVEDALDILVDTVQNATLSDSEVEDAKSNMHFQRENLPPELISRDGAMLAAYANKPLGNFHYCPPSKIDKLSRTFLLDFRKRFYTADNCILAGAAVDHEVLLKSAEKKFGTMNRSSNQQALAVGKSQYTGGLYVEERELKEDFVKCAVAFEIGGWRDSNFVPHCVMQQLLGGGSSFSAGGPGKGMYTRLYREVLNKYGWVESAEAFINGHTETGILGIDGACKPDAIGSMIQVFIDQLLRLTIEQVSPEELSRAKNMLKSMLFMQLESRMVTAEDIARQVHAYGFRKDAISVGIAIDSVTATDLQNLAKKMFDSDPAVSVIGYDVSKVPKYESIRDFTNSYKERVWTSRGMSLH